MSAPDQYFRRPDQWFDHSRVLSVHTARTERSRWRQWWIGLRRIARKGIQ